MAWLGDDRNQAVFRTGAQVQRLNAYSIIGIFRVARDTFLDAVGLGGVSGRGQTPAMRNECGGWAGAGG